MKFKVTRTVTLAVLKLPVNKGPVCVRMEGKMYVGKKVDDKKEPATLAHVVNLATGEENIIICPFLLQSSLRENYTGDSYVGKAFAISVSRDPAKKYNYVSVQEIDPDSVEPDAAGMPAVLEPAIPGESNTDGTPAAQGVPRTAREAVGGPPSRPGAKGTRKSKKGA